MLNSYFSAVLRKAVVAKSNFEVHGEPVLNEKTNVETSTRLEFGFGEGSDSNSVLVRISYDVNLRSGDALFASIQLVVMGTFHVLAKHGFEKWEDMPAEAPVPYFAFVHYIAREKALQAFVAAGFKGVALPIPDELDGTALPVAE